MSEILCTVRSDVWKVPPFENGTSQHLTDATLLQVVQHVDDKSVRQQKYIKYSETKQ
jgi:hypothetical protein